MHWIWFIIAGAIVGALGRLFHPGVDPMGWLLTIAIGIVSMIIAAALSSGWLAFIIGVIVAVILVALVGRAFGNRARPARV
ncbi:MAG: GlsB/YeaQ/YmgE family stress response membrane protein [Gaiellaceae bacterium]